MSFPTHRLCSVQVPRDFILRLCALIALLTLPVNQGKSQTLTTERLKVTIEKYVLHKLQLSKDELLLEFPSLEKQNAAKIAYDEIKILPSRKPVRKGLQLIKCGLYRNSQYLKTLNVNTRIRTFQNVVVSKTKLGRFTIVSPEDLQLARLETTSLTKKTFSSLKEMSGLRTTRLIQTGDVITENLVERLPVIARGGAVDIRFKRGFLEITTPGIARQDGKIGDEIRVKCVESKKSYTAKVIDAKTVLVNL